jgi:hypothetical protein
VSTAPPPGSDLAGINIITGTTLFARLAGLPEGVGVTGSPDPDHPEHNPLRTLRVKLLAEEVQETLDGEAANDPVEIADGNADTIVIAWGNLLTYFGEECAIEVLAEVWRSNLSKVDGSLGPIVRREDGKLLKPQGWAPPDVAGALRRHGYLPGDPQPIDAGAGGDWAGVPTFAADENARADEPVDPDAPAGSSAAR